MQQALALGGASHLPTIEGLALEPLHDGVGLMSELRRCRITYGDAAPDAPSSVIVKLPSTDPRSLRLARQQALYHREYSYYSRISQSAPIRAPALLYSDYEEHSHRFVLVLEDLCDMIAPDQAQGISGDQAVSAITAVARLHGHYWEDVDRHHLSGFYDFTRARLGPLMQMAYLAYLPSVLDKFGHLFPEPMRRLAETFGPRVADYVADATVGPRTFIHGDFRAANMFFGPGAGRELDFAVVDWQVCGIGIGLFDVAYLLCSSVPTEVRRQVEREALGEYHDIVSGMGARDFSFDECWRLYRRYVLGRLLLIVFVAGSLNLEHGRYRHTFETSIQRTLAAIEDLEADEFLPDRRPFFSRSNAFSTLSAGTYKAYRLLRR